MKYQDMMQEAKTLAEIRRIVDEARLEDPDADSKRHSLTDDVEMLARWRTKTLKNASIEKGRKKQCILYSLDEFNDLLAFLTDGKVLANVELLSGLLLEDPDGISLDGEARADLFAALAKELGAESVTSIHVDDEDLTGVWIVLSDEVPSVSNVTVPLDDGLRLIARRTGDPWYREIAIDIEDETGKWGRPLVVAGERCTHRGDDVIPIRGRYFATVWTDPLRDDTEVSYELAPVDEHRERCRGCAYLVEEDDEEWMCSKAGKEIHMISDEDCTLLASKGLGKEIRCCFCGGFVEAAGNDPWPLSKEHGAKCCNRCNITKVVPTRLRMLMDGSEAGAPAQDTIDRSDYIATKLWSAEDVRGVLEERGFKGTDEEVDAVINTGYLKSLNECTDRDWDIIDAAVTEAQRRGDIRKPEDGEEK